jgi:hypothetical protein
MWRPDGTFAKFHILSDLADAQALNFDHLRDLQLEACIKGSSRLLVVHVGCHLGLKKPIVVFFKLDHHTVKLTRKPRRNAGLTCPLSQ